MDTAIVVLGMLIPIAAASLFYVEDRRRAHVQPHTNSASVSTPVEHHQPEQSASDGVGADAVGTAPEDVDSPAQQAEPESSTEESGTPEQRTEVLDILRSSTRPELPPALTTTMGS